MSRHQAVRNLDYEEVLDEYDAQDTGFEDGGDQITPEDREALANGTEAVRTDLGTESEKVTTQQIHDALWYYYYDIEKTVAYLRKKFISPQPAPEPKKPKQRRGHTEVERLVVGEGRCWSSNGTLHTHENGHFFPPPELPWRLPPSWYFGDMPWLNTPKHRQTEFIAPMSVRVRGGLLGGGEGPKLSKLQALAASRKKKAEAGKRPEDSEDHTQKSLSDLKITDQLSRTTPKPEPSSPAKRPRTTAHASSIPKTTPAPPAYPNQGGSGVDQAAEVPNLGEAGQHARPDGPSPSLQPSAFAQVMCGSTAASSQAAANKYPLPYTESPYYNPAIFERPSPDDVVLAAQAKASKFDAAAAKSASAAPKKMKASAPAQKADDTPANEVNRLSLGEISLPKSKNLNVVQEFEKGNHKKSASFVVVGHVDAGKSTLMGRLLLELKFVEQHQIDRYRRQADKIGKSSFALAWVMDQREEERERGVTIDIATNQFETEKTRFTILDAPGHRDFVPNMIAGASQADFAVLVIDANTGAFEKGLKGQTREHALLLRSLGVQRVIVAVNKLDMVGWSQDRFNEISEQVTGFMKGNGFQLKNVTFIPISGLNGDNLVRKSNDEALSWYTGTTLIEALEDSEPMTRALQKPFRMSISEIFRSQQSQITVSGRIESGTIQMGESLLVQPSGEPAGIRFVEVDSQVREWAVAGQNVSIGLHGIDPIHIRVGDIICNRKDPIQTSDELTMKVLAFDHLMPMPVDVHRGRLHAPGRIQAMPALLNKTTGALEKKNPKIVPPAKVARVIVKLESKVPLEPGQRVVLRTGGETVAAGLLE